ncbi:MAG TPA: YoaK family protein [Bryobacteraceae bacterium]|nr:YoaK family protein [Bryobacteraceae bacterium]
MQVKTRFFLAAFITWLAGFVDAIGFISLSDIYTANMSGNSVAVGIQLASQNWPAVIHRFWPVVTYVLGLLFCRILIEFGARERIRSIGSLAWIAEIACLTPVCVSPIEPGPQSSLWFLFVGLLAFAMGIQNATLTHFSGVTLNTGFVTGSLVKFGKQLTAYLTSVYDSARRPGGSASKALFRSFHEKPFRLMIGLSTIWPSYVAGAVCGALGDYNWHFRSLLIAIACLSVLTAIDLRTPLALPEERAQEKTTESE